MSAFLQWMSHPGLGQFVLLAVLVPWGIWSFGMWSQRAADRWEGKR